MERNFYHEEFEHFLKQKADQYKMYPSDRVWNNINRSQTPRKRWLALSLILLFVSSALFTGRQIALNSYSNIAKEINHRMVSGVPETLPLSPLDNHAAGLQPEGSDGNVYIGSIAAMHHNTTIGIRRHGKAAPDGLKDNNPGLPAPVIRYSETDSPSFGSNTGNRVNITPELPAAEQPLSINAITAGNSAGQQKIKGLTQNDNAAMDIPSSDNKKLSIQLYASPIVSYRRLINPGSSPAKYVPVAISYTGSVDNYVRHKPAIGFEFGTKAQYTLTDGLSLYAGAQLNYSRYYIDAYNSFAERATIALNSNFYTADTVANYTSIRNFQGSSPEQLQNQYFQVSVPLGAELTLLGSRRIGLSIAGAIQPTYLISSNSYLISSDFKNYMQNPNLARRFNLHTNVEAFVSYKLGGLKWQLGPQFRYQVFSSYSDKYPLREYLTEFGVKLGVTKTIR
jgi:hypothetical protein